MNYQKILHDLGYERHLNKTACVFSDALDKTISYLGKHSKDALISYVQSITKFPKNDCFVYYSITKNALEHVFGEKSANEILHVVKEEIIIHENISSNESLEHILNDLSKRELLEFIRTLNGHIHILYLYNDKEIRNKIMSEYFSSVESFNGLLSLEPMKINNVQNTLLETIQVDESKIKEKLFEFISEVESKNKSNTGARFFTDDTSLWFKNGLTNQYLEAEQSVMTYIEKKPISCICACDINEISDDAVLRKLISSHNYVIFDEPFAVYHGGV